MTDQKTSSTARENLSLSVEHIQKIHTATIDLARLPDLPTLEREMTTRLADLIDDRRVLLLSHEASNNAFSFTHVSSELDAARQKQLKNTPVNTQDEDPILQAWLDGDSYLLAATAEAPQSNAAKLIAMVGFEQFYGVSLQADDTLLGVLVVEISEEKPFTNEDRRFIDVFTESAQVMWQNARQHQNAVQNLADKMREMGMLQQIDRELNETIALNTVFSMTLDWALRFTNANSATVALYDEETDTLRTASNYGYMMSDTEIEAIRSQHDNTIVHRVARSSRLEVVPDVMLDKDYAWVSQGIRAQMAIPVMREDRVVAVILLESKRLNAFTDAHVNFVQQLANRAAVAIDNARLYNETVRERERLANILASIGDVVILLGTDDKILLMSQSAISALRLNAEVDYTGQDFTEVVTFMPLVKAYQSATDDRDNEDTELTLPNERTYAVRLTLQPGTGLMIVMQDITLFKEMDRLKGELIAQVSHDLKQPLGVMRGYLDLLVLKNKFDDTSSNFVNMIDRSIDNMRQLIDDLLDLARIESGLDLEFEVMPLRTIINECLDANRPAAAVKDITLITDLPEKLPLIKAEANRLRQVFNNLIGNAIKYTPSGGTVEFGIEWRGMTVRISVDDTGIGIGPEDQPHVFDRFYRVRRPETDNIDGTGLGLAIVKSLVEAHGGKIRLESQLSQGSTFFVTLPVYDE
jgi:signal transduction histidine kinase